MMDEYFAVPISPSNKRAMAQMDALLAREGIERDRNLTYSAAIYDDDGQMIATGSLFENTLRCLAVDGAHRGEGLMAVIVAHLVQAQIERGHTHLFLYTKVDSAKFFAPLGFTEIARVDGRLVFMENRRDGFSRYLKSLAPYAGERPGSALVIRAAKENERVVLFVLSEDRSLVPYSDRMAMVKAACAKYGNVSVVSSGSYMISSATFPSYFLKDADVVTRTHAELDATLFTRIAAALNLTRRYVGEEPFSHTTSLYNEALAAVLPKAGVELVVIPRAQAQGEAISASHVRQLIHDGHIEAIRPLVPETTYAYLTGDAGQTVLRRIQVAADVIHH